MNIDREEFKKVVGPVIEFLEKYNPHVKIIIDSDSAEFVSGEVCVSIGELDE